MFPLQTLKRKQAALLSQLDELDQECSSLREEVTEVRVHRQKLEEELQGLQESHQQLQLQFREKEVSVEKTFTVLEIAPKIGGLLIKFVIFFVWDTVTLWWGFFLPRNPCVSLSLFFILEEVVGVYKYAEGPFNSVNIASH